MTKKKLSFKRAWLWLKDYCSVVLEGVKHIGADNISILASGMVYSTLIAIIPCITFLSAFLSAFGGLNVFFNNFSLWLTETFGSETGSYVMEKVMLFSQNAMSLGIVGLVSFVITGLLLASKIDDVVNRVFRTRDSQAIMIRYAKLLVVLIVFTVVLAFGISVSSEAEDRIYSIIGINVASSIFEMIMNFGGKYAATFILFFLLLFFVPNVKVNFSSALAGSVLGTVIMAAAYFIFTKLIINTVKYSVIYGSLASILLVLLLLYIIWYIIIIVAEITYIHQFRPESDYDYSALLMPKRELNEGLEVLKTIAKKYEKCEGAISLSLISSLSRVNYSRTLMYLKIFEKKGYIVLVGTSSYILARPSSTIKVEEVIEDLFSNNEKQGSSIVESFKKGGLESIKGKNLGDLIK